MLELNIVALTRLTRWALPAMIEKKSGYICNVGSTAGIIPLPSFAVYAASKAYVNSFSEALRVEVRAFGVHVIALCPGPVETEFVQAAMRPNGKRKFTQPPTSGSTKKKSSARRSPPWRASRAVSSPASPFDSRC